MMWEQVGDLSFTGDGLAKKGVLVRHLVMPGFAEEGERVVRWLGERVSRDLYLHVMEQYSPRAHVGKEKRKGRAERKEVVEPGAVPASEGVERQVRYAEIDRPVGLEEVERVKMAAR